jgi:hypothetical protein
MANDTEKEPAYTALQWTGTNQTAIENLHSSAFLSAVPPGFRVSNEGTLERDLYGNGNMWVPFLYPNQWLVAGPYWGEISGASLSVSSDEQFQARFQLAE